MLKLEYQALKNLGVSDEALNIYSDSDFEFYLEESELISIKINNELISNGNSPENIDKFLLSFLED